MIRDRIGKLRRSDDTWWFFWNKWLSQLYRALKWIKEVQENIKSEKWSYVWETQRGLKDYYFWWSLASTSVVVHIVRCFLTSEGVVLGSDGFLRSTSVWKGFRGPADKLTRATEIQVGFCTVRREKDSQVSVSKFKAQHGIIRWSSRVQHVVICCEEDVGSQHEFLKEHVKYQDTKAEWKSGMINYITYFWVLILQVFTGTQEQFEVELFETITKLNKIMENSLRVTTGRQS